MPRASEWAKHVSEWRLSGESGHVFATRRRLNPRSLSWWATEFKRRAASTAALATATVRSTPAFARVEVAAPESPEPRVEPAVIELILQGGVRVLVGPGCAVRDLRTVLEALGAR
jgi:hypothetical protein